jgi:hypothetical protein
LIILLFPSRSSHFVPETRVINQVIQEYFVSLTAIKRELERREAFGRKSGKPACGLVVKTTLRGKKQEEIRSPIFRAIETCPRTKKAHCRVVPRLAIDEESTHRCVPITYI